jgi:hypothetical protein
MQNNMAHFGRDRGLKMYADWTDAIAAGATPQVTPPRPKGVERNVVLTIQDWGGGHSSTTRSPATIATRTSMPAARSMAWARCTARWRSSIPRR